MPKFFPHKKKKKSSLASVPDVVVPTPVVSPLMADEKKPKSSPSSNDYLAKDKEREKRRKEREEQRKKRGERLANSRASEENREKSKKKSNKSRPKLSQEEQDAKDANLGCCHKFSKFLVKTIHLVDFLIGLIFVVYGSLIMISFENPAMEAVITSLTFGCSMLFTSIMGVIGFTTKVCKRFGLVFSAYMAPFIAFFYMFTIMALLSSSDVYFDYLTEHKDVLFLDEAEILTLENLLPLFYIILACLMAVEICRFMVLRKIRQTLIRYDAATKRIGSSRSNMGSSRSNMGSNRTNLTEPLLDDDEEV